MERNVFLHRSPPQLNFGPPNKYKYSFQNYSYRQEFVQIQNRQVSKLFQ